MEIIKLGFRNLTRRRLDRLRELELNCGLPPYSVQMLLECILRMDTFVCLADEEIAGFITMTPSSAYIPNALYLVNLNVDAAWRRKGIGTALIRRACGSYREKYPDAMVVLDVTRDNPAKNLYENLGFRITSFASRNGPSDVVMAAPLRLLLERDWE